MRRFAYGLSALLALLILAQSVINSSPLTLGLGITLYFAHLALTAEQRSENTQFLLPIALSLGLISGAVGCLQATGYGRLYEENITGIEWLRLSFFALLLLQQSLAFWFLTRVKDHA
jgi:hypothetical protein